MKKLLYTLAVPVALLNIVAGMLCFRAESLPAGDESARIMDNLDRLVEVMQLIRRNYVDADKLDSVEMLRSAIMGLTVPLDPFSEYIPPDDMQYIDEYAEGSFGGIGVQVMMKNGVVSVVSTVPGAPAARAGILAGDSIVEIDGSRISDYSSDRVAGCLRGKSGSAVKVGIVREGEKEMRTYELVREDIPVFTVKGARIIPGTRVGYIQISEFMLTTAADFEKELRRLVDSKGGMEALIIDLRDNGGGLLDSAVEICSMFIAPGEVVVSTEGRGGKVLEVSRSMEKSYRLPEHIPLAVLINDGSASASEITASCLRDFHRAALVGTRSFGKGSVQSVQHFSDGSGLKLTIAKYYTKSHTEIHGIGLTPDFTVEIPREERQRRLGGAGGYSDHLQDDPQVEAALNYFRNGCRFPAGESAAAADVPSGKVEKTDSGED